MNHVAILKFFLHISKNGQKKRLRESKIQQSIGRSLKVIFKTGGIDVKKELKHFLHLSLSMYKADYETEYLIYVKEKSRNRLIALK